MQTANHSSHPRIDPARPLVIVDVDEVLGLFMLGFARFVAEHGYELRLERFALFQNLYRQGETQAVDMETGRNLFNEFFRIGAEEMETAPHAVESLAILSGGASVVILTNAPDHARAPRARWLARHGMDYPLIINEGPKGGAVAALAAQTSGPVAFIDDLIPNLDSAAQAAPHVHRFQLVADPRLAKLAPSAPDRHARIDHWPTLRGEITRVLGLSPPAP
ncbi:MAG: hypothetical protein P4L64_02400 [Caulobacteraceae bacterium]|nr:hypothetical protein [Caulobacteraceae bacterium]